jgi:hypothetical protein
MHFPTLTNMLRSNWWYVCLFVFFCLFHHPQTQKQTKDNFPLTLTPSLFFPKKKGVGHERSTFSSHRHDESGRTVSRQECSVTHHLETAKEKRALTVIRQVSRQCERNVSNLSRAMAATKHQVADFQQKRTNVVFTEAELNVLHSSFFTAP